MKYSIIIPTFNKEKMTMACVESVKKYSTDYEIIIVDNGNNFVGSGEEFIIWNKENLGFPRACNQGIAKAKGEVIVLLNNDTIVTPHWLEYLGEHLKNYDIIGPLTNDISGQQKINLGELGIPDGLNLASKEIHERSAGRAIPYHRIVFFCVAIKKEVLENIGDLDEIFTPGNYEDDDFCLRAIEAGYKLGIAQDCLIYHAGSATFRKNETEYEALLLKNEKILKAKWPKEKYEQMVKWNFQNCANIPKLPKRTLALSMVVKNEELGLEKAIASCRDFVDEVHILVDRASTDKTLEIAKKSGATVKEFDWFDDFAGARNLGNKDIKTDWILFLDGHEFVTKHDDIEAMLESPADGLLCTVRLETGSDIRNPRIFRNGLIFTGKVHEIQNCRSMTVYKNFIVQHARIGGQSDEGAKIREVQRNDQMERIMGQQIKDDPTDTRAAFHLALHRQSMGDFKGALKIQKIYFKTGKMTGERWYVYFNRTLCHIMLGNYIRALWSCRDAEKESKGRWEIAKLRGIIHMQTRNYTKAIKYFVDSFDENKGETAFKPYARNDAEAWNAIGECYFQLERPDLAKKSFDEAANFETDETKKKFFADRAKAMQEVIENI